MRESPAHVYGKIQVLKVTAIHLCSFCNADSVSAAWEDVMFARVCMHVHTCSHSCGTPPLVAASLFLSPCPGNAKGELCSGKEVA